MTPRYDVVVVGAGNAALCAAIAAAERGSRVVVLEKAPRHRRGGNSALSGGVFRIPHQGLADVMGLLAEEENSAIDIDPYSSARLHQDLVEASQFRADPSLIDVIAREARPSFEWLQRHGAKFELAIGFDEVRADGKVKFMGGDNLRHSGGGAGLVDFLFDRAEQMDVAIRYEAEVVALSRTDVGVHGVRLADSSTIAAGAVILACGGFESNAAMRAAYIGPGWDLAKPRGTEYNTGDGHKMAMAVGARPWGHWSGCHSVAWDYFAPDDVDRKAPDRYQRYSYWLGIMVNRAGQRFFDEGSNLRAYTYSTIGRRIAAEPGCFAVQIFDAKTFPLLRRQYREARTTQVEFTSIAELAKALDVDTDGLQRTVVEFNSSVGNAEFDPTRKDGKCTTGISPAKSNWAMPLDEPPYYGFPVTAAVTFTFGGLRVTSDGAVLDSGGRHIPCLYAIGEIAGGIFYHSYPGGSGLVSGMVLGRRAGSSAAADATDWTSEIAPS